MRLETYVGRIVSLRQESFRPVVSRARRQGMDLENRFIVASVNADMRKLICYGADFRVAVNAADVALL
ncbi:MAG: hypothetical protein ACM3Y9_15690 [Ignavibacteria bacterium]